MMRALGRWVVRRRDLAIDEYREAVHALAVVQHSDRAPVGLRGRAEERVRAAERRVNRWERIRFVVHGDGGRS